MATPSHLSIKKVFQKKIFINHKEKSFFMQSKTFSEKQQIKPLNFLLKGCPRITVFSNTWQYS